MARHTPSRNHPRSKVKGTPPRQPAPPPTAPAEPSHRSSGGRGLWVIRASSLWILAGAIAKSLTGTPSELPAPILDSSLDPFTVIVVAVGVEMAVGVLALARPRLGWLPLAGAYAVFTAILVGHMQSGSTHCGCFGGAFPIPVAVMLAIDASLAIIVVSAAIASKAWQPAELLRSLWAKSTAITALAGIAVGLALAWYADTRLQPLRPIELRGASETIPMGPGAVTDGLAAPKGPPTIAVPVPPPAAAWSLPKTLPSEVTLRPILWINKRLTETELGRFTDTTLFPPNAQIVIYYESCSHCAEHLRQLAAKQAAEPTTAPNFVLVQLPTPEGPNVKLYVDRVPTGMHVKMPEAIKRWVITTPWDLWTEGGVVKRAERVKWPGER